MKRRLFLSGLFSALLIATAKATPGAVNRHGCHGRPRHCHSPSEIRTNGKRRYVAGAFFGKRKSRKRARTHARRRRR